MSGKDLFAGMGCIDERFIAEAESCTLPRGIQAPWLRAASMAACLCLMMLSLWCIRPFLNGTHVQPPETTFPLIPEGFQEVIVLVEEMTGDGFTGTIAELVTPGSFALGMEVKVTIPAEALVEGEICSGCHVLVVCSEYDPEASAIVAEFIQEVQPSP